MAAAVFLVMGGPGVARPEIVTSFEGVVRGDERFIPGGVLWPGPVRMGQVVEAVAEHLAVRDTIPSIR